MFAVPVAVVEESRYLLAAEPVRVRPVAVTVLAFPTLLSAKLAVPPVQLTFPVSAARTPLRVQENVAVAVPSYGLLVAVMLGVTVAWVIVKVCEVLVPPPGAGVVTVIGTPPGDVSRSLAGMAAVTCPEFTNVVGRALPFQFTTVVDPKLVPLAIRLKPDPP
jgi:hypothetical protein